MGSTLGVSRIFRSGWLEPAIVGTGVFFFERCKLVRGLKKKDNITTRNHEREMRISVAGSQPEAQSVDSFRILATLPVKHITSTISHSTRVNPSRTRALCLLVPTYQRL
jgi:hypothetical protein